MSDLSILAAQCRWHMDALPWGWGGDILGACASLDPTKGEAMTKIFLLAGAMILAACTALVLLGGSSTHPAPQPSTSTSYRASCAADLTNPTINPDHLTYDEACTPDSTMTSIPGMNLPGLATATPGQVWISAGPGDAVCHAPGDCGYGDN